MVSDVDVKGVTLVDEVVIVLLVMFDMEGSVEVVKEIAKEVVISADAVEIVFAVGVRVTLVVSKGSQKHFGSTSSASDA